MPLAKQNYNTINFKYFKLMKNNSILINTARGGLVNENDLYKILNKRKKIRAYFDVLNTEPPKRNKLFKLNNFFISSHIGGTTKETIEYGGKICIKSLLNKNKIN